MAVDATLMFNEVDLITKSGLSRSNFRLELQILINDEWISPTLIEHYSVERDYENGWGEQIMVTLMFGLGTYTYKLLPNRDNLLVEFRFIPLKLDSAERTTEVNTIVERYRGILVSQENQGLTGKHSQATTEEMLNRAGPVSIEMQLIDEINYKIRMIQVGRLFNKIAPVDALVLMLIEESKKLGGNDSQRILGVDVTPGYSKEVRNVLSIEHGKPLTQVPLIIQNEEGGVYPTGLGRFVQNQYWWIYPLYDVERVNKKLRRLVIYNVPTNRLDGSERTYRLEDDQVIVLATGDAKSFDPSMFAHLNMGNGLRFTDARKLMDGFGVAKDNRMLVDRATNLFEVTGRKLATGMNNVVWSKDRSTGNPLKQYSDLARTNGQFAMLVWRHGDIDLLMPGMPVEYRTVHDDELKTFKGVLLGTQEQRIPAESGAKPMRWPSSIVLKVFISNDQGQ